METETLAEENTRQIIHEVTKKPVSAAKLEQRLRDVPSGTILNLWTQTELDLMGEYVPTTFRLIARQLELDEKYDRTETLIRAAFQFQAEVVNTQSTIDVCIFDNRTDEQTLRTKIYSLNRMIKILSLLRVNTPDIIDPIYIGHSDPRDMLVQIKQKYAEILAELPDEWMKPAELIVGDNADLDEKERTRFGFVKDILNQVGEEYISAIVLYGSASREKNPEDYQDYDLYIVAEDYCLEEIYSRLTRMKNKADGKDINFNAIEKRSFAKFIRMTHDPRECLESCIVLYGKAGFSELDETEATERGRSYAVMRTKALKYAAAKVVADPSYLLGKKGLYESYQKSNRYIMQAILNSQEGFKVRTKAELDSALALEGGKVNPYVADKDYIVRTTCEAAVCATKLLEKYFAGKKCEFFVNINAPADIGFEEALDEYESGWFKFMTDEIS